MALAAGTKLGSYEVLAQIGAGGTSLMNCDERFQSASNCNRVQPCKSSITAPF
jgi:hypothetical protein